MKLHALLLYLVVMVVGALYFYTDFKQKETITITSEIAEINPILVNRKYFDKKLGETGFWREQNITIYNNAPLKSVTVKKLSIILTDRPQLWGQSVEKADASKPHILSSYGQEYDSRNNLLKLYIHIDRNSYMKSNLNKYYSGQLLYAAYDMTHHFYTGQQNNRFVELEPFLRDFKENPENNLVVKLN